MASTLSTTYVNGLYTNLIGFTDPAGTAAWAAQIDLGTSPYNVANAFLDVYQQSGAPVALLYQAAFGRVPDYDGYAYWLNNFKTVSAGDPLLLSQQFYASTEFANRIGGDPTNLTESAYVNALYLNVLGRPGDPSGATYWTDWLTAQETALGGTDTAKDTARNQLLDIFAMSGENVSEHGKQIETFTIFAGFDNRAPTTAEFTAAETQAELTTVTGVVGASPNFGTTGPAPVPIFALSLAADPASVVEGSASTFTVTTNVPTLAALDYNISVVGDTLGGTAGAASSNDFGTLPTTVQVATGASTATFAITPVADNITEGPEGFKVTLLNGATPVVSTTALITDLVDSTPPVVTAGQVIPYAENLVAGATVGTVAATDNIGVTGFTIASGNNNGYFAIDSKGVVTLTAAGAAAGSPAETSTILPNQFVLGVTASDAAGNVSTAANVTLNVLDTTAPVATAAAIGASGNSLVMAFNEALVTSKLPLPTDFAVVQNGSTAVAVSTVTINGSSVTLGLGSSVSGTVTVSYTPNTDPTKDLQDAAGNSVAAITNKSVVVDTIAPTLSGSVPADGATDVTVGANIVLTMSETVKAGTGNIVIANSADGTDTRTIAVTDTTQVTFSGSAVTINPTTDLKTGGIYTVTMNAGVITDLVGNSFAGLSGTDLNFNTPGGGGGTGNTVVLTVGVDNLSPTSPAPFTTTDNNDTIQGENAVVDTINPADVMNGGGGTDTANLFIRALKTGQLTSTSVENFFIQATQEGAAVADGDSTFNAVAVTGVQQWWSNNSQENLIVSNVAALATVGIIGGVDVGSDGTGDADYKVNFNSGIASASATLSVAAQGALIDDLQVGNADGSQEFGTVTINSTVANSSIDDIKDGGGADPLGLTKVLFTGATRMTIGSELENVTTFDSTGSTGGARVVIDETKDVTFTGGAGPDRVDVNNALGAGLTSADKLDGGSGTGDVLRLRHDQNLTAGDVANVKNWDTFEGFAGAIADATYDLDIFVANNAFVGVQVSSGAAADDISITNIPGAAAAAIRVVNDIDDVTLTVKTFVPGGTSDTATILVDNANNSAAGKGTGVDIAGPLTFTNVDVLNIQSISDGSPVAAEQNSILGLLATDMNKLVITGDQDFAVTTNAASLELTEVDASGMSLVANEGLAFDASGTAISSLLIRGTAKNDTLVVSNPATTATIFTGGGTDAVTIEGTSNDSLNFTSTAFNAGDVKAGNVVTVTGVLAVDDLTVAFAGAFNNLLKVGGATLGTSLANVALTAAFNTTPAGLTNVIYVDAAGGGASALQFDLNGDGLYTQTDDFAIVLLGGTAITAGATYNATTDTFAFT